MKKFLLSLLAVFLILPMPVLAAGSIDVDKICHLTLSYQTEEEALSGAKFDIYRVASVDGNGELHTADMFKDFNVDIRGENDGAWKELASTLEGYVLRDKIETYASGQTDALGMLSFDYLETGLYLVLGQRHTQNGYIYDAEPFMIMLPTIDKEADDWLYDMNVKPKYEVKPVPIDYVSRKVIKVWEDDGFENERPKEVVVQLLKDGEVFDTVTLNADNNWRYTWDKLDDKYTWKVVEKELDGYKVSAYREGNTFVITNTYTKDTPPPITPPELPQTGQLWWPVPVLITGGLCLIVVGLVSRRRNQDEK